MGESRLLGLAFSIAGLLDIWVCIPRLYLSGVKEFSILWCHVDLLVLYSSCLYQGMLPVGFVITTGMVLYPDGEFLVVHWLSGIIPLKYK